MANLLRIAAGTLLTHTWTNLGFTASDFNSLANGSFVLATTALTNQDDLDLLMEVSFSVEVGGTTTASSFLSLYMMPLNQDGTTYGDGTPSGTAMPSPSYLWDTVSVRSGVTSGNAVVGTFPNWPYLPIPPGTFKLGIGNNLGVAMDSTAAFVAKGRSHVLNLNA